MKGLIIEDDPGISEFVSLAFHVGWPGFQISSARLGEDGLKILERESSDVVILDLGLPDISGFEVLKCIRLFSNVPVIIITVKAEESDIVKALETGADEYIVKPFGQMELLARIKAVLRRHRPAEEEPSVVLGPFTFYYSLRKVLYRNREINLTATEGLILSHLATNAGISVSHSSLSEAVWGEDFPGATKSLKVYINRLRAKLEENPEIPKLIITKPGFGYQLTKKN